MNNKIRSHFYNLICLFFILKNSFKNTKNKNKLIILLYHSVIKSNKFLIKNNFVITENNFIDHINSIHRNKEYKFVKINKHTKNYKGINLALTFDDGFKDNLSFVADFLNQYQIPIHIYICTKFLKNNYNDYLNKNELRKLSNYDNVTIGSHTLSHPLLSKLTNKEIFTELSESKKIIEDIISCEVNQISYPNGSFSNEVVEISKELGYLIGLTSIFNSNDQESDNMQLARYNIEGLDTKLKLNFKIKGYHDWYSFFQKI